ncbi:MAG: CRISPR-associated endonuclease Cas3'' [Candidatus Acidiferrales bacterium]
MGVEGYFYAHTVNGQPPERWQLLEDHLRGVAELAADFASAYDAADWAYCAGLWHDVGKYQREFQERLRGSGLSVEHSGAGAALAHMRDKSNGLALAFAIAGHHAGLANPIGSGPGFPSPLVKRLQQNNNVLQGLLPIIPFEIQNHPVPVLPQRLRPDPRFDQNTEEMKRTTELWVRFVFSALVDADRLNTEAFVEPTRPFLRGKFSAIKELREALDTFVERKSDVKQNKGSVAVNAARISVLRQCREAAKRERGLFSLTAPTGSGKTLSSMSFALRHAERWGLRRIIVVIPYTSIIEQNAKEYADALGDHNVVEHHSNLDPEQQKREKGEEFTARLDLAAENWDAPVIVTTTVQFFESLFSNNPSRCRKLHNIADSVIILDEVQTLPPGFLLSITDILSELSLHYSCSVVLSTATPPALTQRESFPQGLRNVRPIVADSDELNAQLQRVKYSWPDMDSAPRNWPSLASEMSEHSQFLTIVHRRQDARFLAQELMKIVPCDSVFHLSALMCPLHRSDVLAQIKVRLAEGTQCRLISTQLIEAGVDVDFRVVYRCLGGVDSIVQAGGRCNREGRLESGTVFVFRAPTSPPPGTPRRALQVTESLLREYSGQLNLMATETFDKYFRMLYAAEDLDTHKIQEQRQGFNFASVGRDFKLIEDGYSVPIVVPYGESLDRLVSIRHNGPSRETLRGIQRFIVNIYRDAFSHLRQAGAVEEVSENLFALAGPFHRQYDPVYGLLIDEKLTADPEALIC